MRIPCCFSPRLAAAIAAGGLISLLLAPWAIAQSLPDTGQDTCWDGTNMVICTNANTGDSSTYPRQDGRHGRDPAYVQGAFAKIGGGQKGFDYTKLDAAGNPLAIQNGTWTQSGGFDSGSEAAGTKWSCVKDNTTGLVWEVKTHDATPGLRDMNNTYTWYSSDASTNGGNTGNTGSNTCNSTLPGNLCNTEAYAAALTAANLCGFNDWRLPSHREMSSLLHLGTSHPAIDTTFFPNTPFTNYYRIGDTYASDASLAWGVNAVDGMLTGGGKGDYIYVRVVAGGSF
ncbi:MAG: DUF1566 domain-containing protein [Burkholderiales bacterium]|jgi:hypothetical protein|nr:MAG: DUF1566 domain-containing protein [Burkholderiales bacterium]